MTPQQTAQHLRRLANDLEAHGDQIDKSLHEQADSGLPAQRFDREGGRSGDHSDPTYSQATRPPATGAHRDHWLAWSKTLDALNKHADVAEKIIRDNHPDSKQRPSVSRGACLGGVLHYPGDTGLRCAHTACAKPWPCHEGETESKFVPCNGSIDPVDGRCRICELSEQSMICARCGTLNDRGDTHSGFCGDCRDDINSGEAERLAAMNRQRVAEHRAKAKEQAA